MRPVVLMSFAGLFAVVATASAQQAPAPTPTPSSAVVTPQTPPPGQQPAPAPPTMPAPGQPQGQRGQQGGQGQPPPPGRGPIPPTVPAPATMAPRPEPPSSWQNVKIDIAISDTVTADVQTRKTVSMLILDGRSGQIRSGASNSLINVDAQPTVRQDGRIYLHVTVEYQPELSAQQTQTLIKDGIGRLPILIESLALILVDGKMMVASQSADPRGDRKVTVEITATVQK